MNDFFSVDEPIITAKAPGRMDVMGGIADYSGSLLLQMPVKQTTSVSIQQRNDGVFHLRTQVKKNKTADFTIAVSSFEEKTLQEAGALIKSFGGGDWAVYVLGCFLVLHKDLPAGKAGLPAGKAGKNIPLTGANIFITSDVPWGKGVSSSAALEVATMNALEKLYNLSFDKTELPVLAQTAENLVAGAPCGLMDQLSSHLGQKNKLLPLICQPHEIRKAISIPRGIYFTGIDSGIRHAVSGASYGDVRTAAFMGYSIIAMYEGATSEELQKAKSSGDWSHLPYKGFLANIPAEVFKSKYSSLLPQEIPGADFLSQFGLSIDRVTSIDENKIYKPLVCAAHPVFENERINEFAGLLKNFKKQTDKISVLKRMGDLMLQSHRGYSSVGLGNEHTDEIVQMVMEAGSRNSIFGARITGGGSGGTVCILSYEKEGRDAVKDIFRRYKTKMKRRLFLFSGSSNGALLLNQ